MDKPNGTYALGVFCTFVRPYVSGESRGISTQKKGFMKDFFDVILESSATDTSDVNKRHYSKAKTAINEGYQPNGFGEVLQRMQKTTAMEGL